MTLIPNGRNLLIGLFFLAGCSTAYNPMDDYEQVTGNTRIGASYSDAPETENLITTGSKSTMAYIQRVLGSNLTLLAYFSRFERENSYTRDNVNLGLQYRF